MADMPRRLQRPLNVLIGHQFLEFWPYYLSALLCLFSTHWIQSHLPFLAKELAETIEQGLATPLTPFIYLGLGTIIFRTLSRLLFFYPARVLEKNLRVELLERLEESNPTLYQKYSEGQIFQTLNLDMEQLRALIGFALLQVGNIIVAMMVLIPQLGHFNAQLLWAILPQGLAFVLFTILVTRNHSLYYQAQNLQGELQNMIMESYIGKKTIKNFHAEESFIQSFQQLSRQECHYFYRAGKRVSVSIPLVALGVGMSLIWGASIIKQQNLEVSSLILFSGFIFLFLEPLMFLSWIGVVFTRSYGAWNRIKSLVQSLDRDGNSDRDAGHGTALELSFWNHRLSFHPLSPGWTVIAGKTGCGKSTLLLQMADIFKKRQTSISLVAQSPYLYNDTLAKNIFLGKMIGANEQRLALDLLSIFALDFLADNDHSLLQLEVGENGKHLSGGQAKRVALIRSILSTAPLLLWDDPFSSVDLILEKQIITELKKYPLMKEKTLILTAHRISTVRACDELLLIDRQRGLVERGPCQQLLRLGKESYAYFQNQMV